MAIAWIQMDSVSGTVEQFNMTMHSSRSANNRRWRVNKTVIAKSNEDHLINSNYRCLQRFKSLYR